MQHNKLTLDINSSLGECQYKLLRKIGEFSSEPIYLVGGPVRDIFLQKKVADLDIMLQGDAISLVKALHKQEILCSLEASKKPTLFKKYKTAKFRFIEEVCEGIDELDFASARKESYSSVGATPDCIPGSLEEDILRRDFSINAMAVSIAPGSFGALFDIVDGVSDMKNSCIRVLHENSFRDDPARIIRAARFIERFNFNLDKRTSDLLEQATSGSYISHISTKRAFSELKKILKEPSPERVFSRLKKWNILSQISTELEVESVEEIKNIILS